MADPRTPAQGTDVLKATLEKIAGVYRDVSKLPSDGLTYAQLLQMLLYPSIPDKQSSIMLGRGNDIPSDVQYVHMLFSNPKAEAKFADMNGTGALTDVAQNLKLVHAAAIKAVDDTGGIDDDLKKAIIDDYKTLVLGCTTKMFTSLGPYGKSHCEPFLDTPELNGPWYNLTRDTSKRIPMTDDLLPNMQFLNPSEVDTEAMKGAMAYLPKSAHDLLLPHVGSHKKVDIPPHIIKQLLFSGKLKPGALLYFNRGTTDTPKKMPQFHSALEMAIQKYNVDQGTTLYVDFNSYVSTKRNGVLTVKRKFKECSVIDITHGTYGALFNAENYPPRPTDYIFPYKAFALKEYSSDSANGSDAGSESDDDIHGPEDAAEQVSDDDELSGEDDGDKDLLDDSDIES